MKSAYKTTIKEILDAKFDKEKGTLSFNNLEISKIDIIGWVVFFQDFISYKSIIVDDKTGKIEVRFFDDIKLVPGNLIKVIGKVHETNQRYIIANIIKKLDDIRWFQLRLRELEKRDLKKEINASKILKYVKTNDTGMGIDIQEIINKFGKEAEKVIFKLIEEGSLFEISKGKVKLLE